MGNGYGTLKMKNRTKDMEAFDALPTDIRNFVSSLEVCLSVTHFADRYKRSTAKGEPTNFFLRREQERLKKIFTKSPTPEAK